jgi:hypothetical protein
MDTIEYRPAKSPYKLIPMPMASPAKLLNDETTVMVKSSFPDRKCSKCHSRRIVTGSVSDSRRGRCFFAPAALKFWKITSSYGTKVESYACIDCGLVWMQTAPKILEDFVRKYCDQKID